MNYKTFEYKWKGEAKNPWVKVEDVELSNRIREMTKNMYLAMDGEGRRGEENDLHDGENNKEISSSSNRLCENRHSHGWQRSIVSSRDQSQSFHLLFR